MKPTGGSGGGAPSIGVRAGGSSIAVRGSGGIEGGRGSISPTFSSRSFAEFRPSVKAASRPSLAKPLITMRETGGGKVASVVKEGKTPLINIHRDTSSKSPFMVGERFSAIRPTRGGIPQRTEFTVKEVAGLSAIRDRVQAARQGQEKKRTPALPENSYVQTKATPETKRFSVTPSFRETRGIGVSYDTINRSPSSTRVEILQVRKVEPVRIPQDIRRQPAISSNVEEKPDRKIIPFPIERVTPSSQEGRGQTKRVNRELPVRIIPFPSERTSSERQGRVEQTATRVGIVVPERQGVNRLDAKLKPVVSKSQEQVQTSPKVENKKRGEELTKPQAQLLVQEYAQKPKAERKITPHIVKAFLTANEIASPVARTVLLALSQEKNQPQKETQTQDGVVEEMRQKVKTVIEANPVLKESIQAHLKIALDVYVNYLAIGYASVTATAIVMDVFMQRVQQEVKRNRKPATQLEPGFPSPTDPEDDDGDKPEKPEEEEEIKEKEEKAKELAFIRAEKTNANREEDIDKVVNETAYTVEDTGYMVVNGEQVASRMRQKMRTTSPILVSEGTSEDTPTIDGSFEEIRTDIQLEVKDSTDIQRARVQIKEIIKRHTAVAAGNPRNATDADVEKVLTVPLEMTAFRMNKGRTNFYQNAA